MRKNSHRIVLIFFLPLIAAVLFVSGVSAAEPAVGKTIPFQYRPQGKLDPFKPFIRKELPGQKKADLKFLSPLQRYGIEQLKLIGIMATEDFKKRRAIIQDPKGKSYILMKGTLIGQNNGKVAEILDDQVIVEEKASENSRKVKTKRIILDLHRIEGEGKL